MSYDILFASTSIIEMIPLNQNTKYTMVLSVNFEPLSNSFQQLLHMFSRGIHICGVGVDPIELCDSILHFKHKCLTEVSIHIIHTPCSNDALFKWVCEQHIKCEKFISYMYLDHCRTY